MHILYFRSQYFLEVEKWKKISQKLTQLSHEVPIHDEQMNEEWIEDQTHGTVPLLRDFTNNPNSKE